MPLPVGPHDISIWLRELYERQQRIEQRLQRWEDQEKTMPGPTEKQMIPIAASFIRRLLVDPSLLTTDAQLRREMETWLDVDYAHWSARLYSDEEIG